MARVLVTGGAGYVGSHACRELAARGHVPITFDNLSRGHRELVKWGPLEVGDLSDPAALDRAFTKHRPDCVMHFAAFAYVGESTEDPALYYRNNVVGTLTLLEAMRRHAVGSLVFSSSCATYGNPISVPLTEDHPQNPINPYGASKLMAERILFDAERAYGIRAIMLRYFNAAGATPSGDVGEMHSPETHAIPLLLMAATGQIQHFDVYGTDYPTPDGSAVRDYVHVCDLATAHVSGLDYLLDGGESIALNLGTGAGTSVLELLRVAASVTGRPVPHRLMARRAGDPPILVADAGKALRVLGWRPSFTRIDDTVATAYDWMCRQTGQATPSAPGQAHLKETAPA